MMKPILLILIVLSLSVSVHAQKKGYKEIQIGTSFKHIRSLHNYKIFSDTTQKNSWFVEGDSLRIFSMDFERLEVITDDNDIINRITFHTKPRVFEDYKEWLSELKYVINVVNSDVGKLNSGNVCRDSEKQWCYAWSFERTKTALLFHVDKVYSSATHFEGNYTVIWIADEHHMADLKF